MKTPSSGRPHTHTVSAAQLVHPFQFSGTPLAWVQVEVKIRLPDKSAFDKLTQLLAPGKKASHAQVQTSSAAVSSGGSQGRAGARICGPFLYAHMWHVFNMLWTQAMLCLRAHAQAVKARLSTAPTSATHIAFVLLDSHSSHVLWPVCEHSVQRLPTHAGPLSSGELLF